MQMVPGFAPASAPLACPARTSPSHKLRAALSSATILMMTSAFSAASRGELATRAPSLANGLDFSALRLKTASGKPFVKRFRAMPPPMMPRPRNAMRGLLIKISGHRFDRNQSSRAANNAQRIAQRAAETGEPNFHHVAVGELHAVAETQGARAKKMHVQIDGAAMRFKLEMMMLDVREAVTHFIFASQNFF